MSIVGGSRDSGNPEFVSLALLVTFLNFPLLEAHTMPLLANLNSGMACHVMASCSPALYDLRRHVLVIQLVLPRLQWRQ